MRVAALLLAGVTGCLGQAVDNGVSPDWDVKAHMAQLRDEVKKLEPLLRKVDPKVWVDKGAPASYARQLQSAQNSVTSLMSSTAALAQDPQRLSVALDAFFRLERMELLLSSLNEGVRRYQSTTLADELNTLMAGNAIHRERLQQHVTDLAAAHEQDLELMNREAQRCRVELSRQAVGVEKSGSKNRKQ